MHARRWPRQLLLTPGPIALRGRKSPLAATRTAVTATVIVMRARPPSMPAPAWKEGRRDRYDKNASWRRTRAARTRQGGRERQGGAGLRRCRSPGVSGRRPTPAAASRPATTVNCGYRSRAGRYEHDGDSGATGVPRWRRGADCGASEHQQGVDDAVGLDAGDLRQAAQQLAVQRVGEHQPRVGLGDDAIAVRDHRHADVVVRFPPRLAEPRRRGQHGGARRPRQPAACALRHRSTSAGARVRRQRGLDERATDQRNGSARFRSSSRPGSVGCAACRDG